MNYCNNFGIQKELTQAKTHEQNGVLERKNSTIMERVRSMTHEAQLPAYLWTKAVLIANYLINNNPTRANGGTTFEQFYSGKTPKFRHLQVFGYLAYVHIPKDNRTKLDSKTFNCFFLGYDTESKVYRLYDPNKKKIILSKDVTCDKNKVGYKYLNLEGPKLESYFPLSRETLQLPPKETTNIELSN